MGVELANDSLGGGPAQDARQERPDPLEVGGRRPGPEEIAAGVEEVELPSQLGAEIFVGRVQKRQRLDEAGPWHATLARGFPKAAAGTASGI